MQVDGLSKSFVPLSMNNLQITSRKRNYGPLPPFYLSKSSNLACAVYPSNASKSQVLQQNNNENQNQRNKSQTPKTSRRNQKLRTKKLWGILPITSLQAKRNNATSHGSSPHLIHAHISNVREYPCVEGFRV